MKKSYESPKAYVEEFTPNEYVAACGESGVVYKFVCNAGDGVYGSVYQETNGQPGLQTTGWNSDDRIATYQNYGFLKGGFHACGATHEAESDSGFYNGYYCAKGNTSNPVEVIIWKGEHNDNVHCTTNLNKDSWETVKS